MHVLASLSRCCRWVFLYYVNRRKNNSETILLRNPQYWSIFVYLLIHVIRLFLLQYAPYYEMYFKINHEKTNWI